MFLLVPEPDPGLRHAARSESSARVPTTRVAAVRLPVGSLTNCAAYILRATLDSSQCNERRASVTDSRLGAGFRWLAGIGFELTMGIGLTVSRND